jgi:putative Ig domain-containing protein
MKHLAASCATWLVASQLLGAVIGDPKKPYEDLNDDKQCQHQEIVQDSTHAYQINFRGTIDGTMTRDPIAYGAYVQGWQPNRSLLIENVGQTDVLNPRIVVNGRRNWCTLDNVVAEATKGYTSDADRARAIWEFLRRQRFHACTWDGECNDVLKVLNVYGYTLCGNEAHLINDLWKAAGLTPRRGYPIGHVVSEVFYDGDYHLLDSDEHVICLERDNKTIASCTDVVRDHDLIKRTHTYGIGRREDRKTDEFSASLYSHEGERKGDLGDNTKHSMDLTLRPGESIEFRWDHAGKEYSAGTVDPTDRRNGDGQGSLIRWGATAYDKLRNGRLRYRPDLSRRDTERGAMEIKNAVFDPVTACISPSDPKQPATVVWQFGSPCVFVGGLATASVQLAEGASADWAYSADKTNWKSLSATDDSGESTLTASLDDVVSTRRQPTYRFWLRLTLSGDALARGIAFDNDIQTSLLSLPELEVGTNRIAYSDSNPDDRQVRITHKWLERSTWHPPQAPSSAVSPKGGEKVSGSQVRFRWEPAQDPDGDRIVDYHFELSEHADMRWPLSPNFEKRTSLTPSKGKPEWTVPYVGLLNPDTTYYWHVQALDEKGVWGPFSKTFRFQVQAPGVPQNVKLTADEQGGFVLTWTPNPQGEPPVAYKVYGSDEKGFSVSDVPYRVNRGKGFCRTMEEYETKPADAADAGMVEVPGNLIGQVSDSPLRVVGWDLELPNTNRAFYRVVAIDKAGNESGPSDYAEVPRPFVVTQPEQRIRVGQPYRHQPIVIRSIGDLRCRRSEKSSYNAAFWDREEFSFKPVDLPARLGVDEQSGVISGSPEAAGSYEIRFKVLDRSGKSRTANYQLIVGE